MTRSPRYCVRCEAETFGDPGTHLCADLAKRLKSRNAQVEAVLDLHIKTTGGLQLSRASAEAIVKRLAGMGVADDE